MASQNLTTTRINRVLRPLRNKTQDLASFSTSCHSHAVSTTYTERPSSRPAILFDGPPPPLSLLREPKDLAALLYSDKDRAARIEMSRKIYAVRDCFRNVLHVAFGSDAPQRRVPSLSALCAGIVGENIQPEVGTEDDEDCARADHDLDAELTETINELYEAVPLQYRQWTLVSHALTIVLNTCPRHPTLFSLLLNLCLERRLLEHAETLLAELLPVAFRSMNSVPPAICHPAHASYLTDLLETWTKTASVRSFSRIAAGALLDAESPAAWSSKAVGNLARDLRKLDLLSFIRMTDGLMQSIQSLEKGKTSKPAGMDSGLRARLMAWMVITVESLASNGSKLMDCETHTAALALLARAETMMLHYRRTDEADIPDAMICLATLCLTSATDPRDTAQLVSLLRRTTHVTTTFAFIASKLPSADAHAAALRAHDLPDLEACLWACALHDLERSSRDPALRAVLIARVDDAERRCFAAQGGWEWEDMVGGWVRASPAVKRRRVDVRRADSVASSSSLSSAASFPSFRAVSESSFTEEEDEKEKENAPSSPMPTSQPRRVSNFSSILADTLMNRTVLHPKTKHKNPAPVTPLRPSAKRARSPMSTPAPVLSSDDVLDMFTYIGSSPAF
ncbi:hypothetical protein PLICRDRAFT_172352 [Plicaturopsis crispa FD-325 SS-3]|nr:hypothetical protein PLICRDRAFT_172352 [Plicaturopsis crispa FD-325 SS-3]